MILSDLWTDYTLRTVALGCAVLGIVSGVLGSFAVLRRQGLMGDALSHAALPGIAAAFLIAQTRAPLPLMAGAAVAAFLGAWVIQQLIVRLGVDSGTALAVVLSVFFGGGIVLLTVIQRSPSAQKAGVDKYLFGQAAGLTGDQVWAMAILGGLALAVCLILYKEFQVLSFDPGFAQSLGLPVHRLGLLLTALLVIAIVIGLKTVGVVLMSAMIVAPGAAARQWTNRLPAMLAVAALIGALCGVAGSMISIAFSKVPTGPVIVLLLALAVVISVFFGSARGIFWSRSRRRAA